MDLHQKTSFGVSFLDWHAKINFDGEISIPCLSRTSDDPFVTAKFPKTHRPTSM